MKLELKHIVGYLPYKVESRDHSNSIYRHTLTIENIYSFIGGRYSYKMILRPLSDLTKEIEVNGEKFVPIEYLTKWCDLNTDMYELRFENLLFVLYNKKEGFYMINDNNFSFFQKLYEWHFDIHGLIEKGLAIDINKIDK